jgi:hypothetical protein
MVLFTRFFPQKHRPSPRYDKVGFPTTSRTATSVRGSISGLQSFLYVQASNFACHPGRSYRYNFTSYGSRDVYFRAPHGLLPPHVSDILAVRIGQLTTWDFHPIKPAALSAAPVAEESPITSLRYHIYENVYLDNGREHL